MLECRSLSLTQGDFRLTADLTIDPGRIVAVIGPSGSGKSTFLGLVAGFLVPDAGRILWDGDDITATPPGERPLSVVFQDNNLFPHLTAFDNVALGISPALRLGRDDRDRVEDALARVGLAGYGGRRPSELSGGQQSRVALARVLLRSRPLLLLDEPFAALGPGLRAEMLGLVSDLAKETGATVLVVSHDPADARRIADQTIFVDAGAVMQPVETQALFDDPPEALAAYLGE